MKKTTDETVRDTIRHYHMIEPGMHVLAGVSGGADSMCLLEVLHEWQRKMDFTLSVLHVEHGLRGEEALEDAAFVVEQCRSRGIPCYVEHVNVKAVAAEMGWSLEEAGRQSRYELFEQYRKKLGADRIAVAHNKNDQAETVLLNLSRGSGVRGLGGIRPVRGRIIRPLLFVSRIEIEEYLRERNRNWRTDGTNLETDYMRNRIRLQALPWLETYVNREAVEHLAAAASRLQKAEDYLERQAREVAAHCVQKTERKREAAVVLGPFLAADRLMQEYVLRGCIRELLRDRGLKDYRAEHIEEMIRLAGMDCGKQMNFPGSLRAVRERDRLVLRIRSEMSQLQEPTGKQELLLERSGSYEWMGKTFQVEYLKTAEKPQVFPEKKYTKWLAYDTIKHNVCLRTRKPGDYLIINANGGKKKLKDYMIDMKIPRDERDRIMLVAEDSHVLWAVGYRISEAAKITGTTERFLKVQMTVEDE